MASPLIAIRKAIIKLLKEQGPEAIEAAQGRAQLLDSEVDLARYSPSAIARSASFKPAAQRGFSENMLTQVPTHATQLIRPSEWAEHTPQLDDVRDRNIIEYLIKSMQEKKMQDLPALWINERPGSQLEAGYEGRHRMAAQRKMFGDDPVPVNLVPGERFTEQGVQGPSQLSPLEYLKRQIMFGDKPFKANPVYMKD